MVSLTLPEIINEQKNRILQKSGLELAFYQYCNNIEQTQKIGDFLYDDEKIAFSGFANLSVDTDRLKSLILEKQPKGIGYSANIYKFIGVHLAARDDFFDYVNDKFINTDSKNRYAILKAFHKSREKLNEKINLNDKSDEEYKILIDFLDDDNLDLIELQKVISIFIKKIISFDTIDLCLLEAIQYKVLEIKFVNKNAVDVVKDILSSFSNAIKRITSDRYDNRTGLTIKDEYDVQDISFSMLKGLFSDLEKEDPVPKIAGKSSRIDMNIRSYGIMIEIKMIKEKDNDHKKYIEQLKLDILNYSAWKELKDLILFTYDPYNKTTDNNHFKELEQIFQNQISFNIHSILVK